MYMSERASKRHRKTSFFFLIFFFYFCSQNSLSELLPLAVVLSACGAFMWRATVAAFTSVSEVSCGAINSLWLVDRRFLISSQPDGCDFSKVAPQKMRRKKQNKKREDEVFLCLGSGSGMGLRQL